MPVLTGVITNTPALFTRMSSLPNLVTVDATTPSALAITPWSAFTSEATNALRFDLLYHLRCLIGCRSIGNHNFRTI